MLSKRLEVIASLISSNDLVLDVGCDHGYLDIYLKEKHLCKEVYASDISLNALNVARHNFEKSNLDIKTFVTNGFENIPVKFNTAVISGMGTNTILDIIKNKKTPKKLIISSHNELYKLRKNLNKLGYKIVKENIVLENSHYYVIIMCIKGKQELNENELKFGISNDTNYFNYLYLKNLELIKQVPKTKKEELIADCEILKNLIEKK